MEQGQAETNRARQVLLRQACLRELTVTVELHMSFVQSTRVAKYWLVRSNKSKQKTATTGRLREFFLGPFFLNLGTYDILRFVAPAGSSYTDMSRSRACLHRKCPRSPPSQILVIQHDKADICYELLHIVPDNPRYR
nr:hypothetical protein CFP56_11799 [Quercus suber]